ncbi:MAG: TolC family protein [Vicinamibacterales bacterium]
MLRVVCTVITMSAVAVVSLGCAARAALDQDAIVDRLRARTGAVVRLEATSPGIPSGVNIDDGVTQDEAVAVALWNNAEFQVQLANLGFARADVLEAGLLRNPVLSVLFPIGPKQLEATLRWPIEVLWQRPKRMAMATAYFDRTAASLEEAGLALVADVKMSFIEAALADDRARLAEQATTELDQISKLTQSRLTAGDISDLEARTAEIDAARARQDLMRARLDAVIRMNDLRQRLGLATDRRRLALSIDLSSLPTCEASDTLMTEALASRPDVRAAELAVDAAGRRLGWERSRVGTFTAALDANSRGTEGFEMGPGLDLDTLLFDRNQAGKARARAEMQQAGAAYLATRQRVATQLNDAVAQVEQATSAISGWRNSVVEPLEGQVKAAERAYAGGEASYLFVLEMSRRLTDARVRARESQADLARALARIERAVGRRCGTAGREISRGF